MTTVEMSAWEKVFQIKIIRQKVDEDEFYIYKLG